MYIGFVYLFIDYFENGLFNFLFLFVKILFIELLMGRF